ncbi:MAG: NADH-quinone oxidoreductase subunit A [Ilumatobacteraceae bacterium]
MSSFLRDYLTVVWFAAIALVLASVLLGVAALVRPSKPSAQKLLAYESGVNPVGDGWSQSQVRYYIFALLFVVFDVEAVFIFPWATQLERYGTFGLVEMGIFVFVLLLGLVYAWRKGVLRWV